ncbi:MAG: hypothetical protein ACP5GJ_00995 [Nanopusillaceae archaeon]|jgi:heme/copper-type cytochrome/quinol oxidase subunit 2
MKNQQYIYWAIISFILIVVASIFAFSYIYKVNKNINGENNVITLNCNQLYKLYNESYYKIIDEKIYLTENCTINNITIPAGYRIIYIYEGNISYI